MKRSVRLDGLLMSFAVVLQCVLAWTLVTGVWGDTSASDALPPDDILLLDEFTPSENLGSPGGEPQLVDNMQSGDATEPEDENSDDEPVQSVPRQPDKEKSASDKSDSADAKASAKGSGSSEEEGGSEASETTASLGEPLAPGMMTLLGEEIVAGLKRRNIGSKFARFRGYAARKLDETAGTRRTSEVTGNCRLSWYDHLLRNPLTAPAEAEKFTRELYGAVLDEHEGLDRALAIAGTKLDVSTPEPRSFPPVTSSADALETVRQSLTEAQVDYAEALSTLTHSQIKDLTRNLAPVLSTQNRVGHTLSNRGMGRRLCDVLEKIDRGAMVSAARALVPLTGRDLLDQLATLDDEEDEAISVDGATGPLTRRISTPSGDILIGGRGQNTYQLDRMPDVNVVIDLGGDDIYYEGTVSPARPVLIVIDLDGDDKYQGTKPGVQGAAVLGISMLLDVAGDDLYQAKDVAQGSCLGGAGILIDYAGNDGYVGVRRVQGQAIGGLGILIDHDGDDEYHGAMWTQGFGGPIGFGMLTDLRGKDHYYTGGLFPDSYEETPGYEGWGQGIGAGIRQVANGGIGVIFDGAGDDIYEYDYISHGGGYWLGLGFARDFGGNDQRLGATRKAYAGGPRTEKRFQRFAVGFGCHYALGFCFDDAGNDSYGGTIMGTGFAWDVAVGILCDFAGSDRYEATGGGTQGNGAQAGLGAIFDYNGDDVYSGRGQGNASGNITYHEMPYCGGNFSFVVDYGGEDKYGCGARNSSYVQRGSAGGFIIDRPRNEEADETAGKSDETSDEKSDAKSAEQAMLGS